MFTIHGLRHIAFYKTLSISREKLQMELNTGAAVSVMSEQIQTQSAKCIYIRLRCHYFGETMFSSAPEHIFAVTLHWPLTIHYLTKIPLFNWKIAL